MMIMKAMYLLAQLHLIVRGAYNKFPDFFRMGI